MLMIRMHVCFVWLCLVYMCWGVAPTYGVHTTTPFLNAESHEPALHVRVLLDEHAVSELPTWNFSSSSGFILQDVDAPHRQHRIPHTHISLSYHNHAFWLRNKRISAKQLRIYTPDSSSITYDDAQYAGYMTLAVRGKHAYLINTVDIEEYVFSVLRWEGWPGWPDEVNKTFAIMCRTYVVDKVWSQRHHRKRALYDIKNTNIHQTYKGLHDFTRLRDAVQATDGIILTYQGKPIVAMYDACCGGVIPADVSGVDFRKAPYLARTYPCTFCQSSKLYTWTRRYTTSVFQHVLSEYVHVADISDVTVSKRDDADVVQEIHVHGAYGHVCVPGPKLYTLLKGLRSLCFSVYTKDDTVEFHGYGLGHHIGLCQWGAREMVRLGWDYVSILQFFYPSVSFKRLRVCKKGA